MLDLIVAVLCAYRLTQLVVWDDILGRPIDWLAERSVWFTGLVNCAHCTGVWCSTLTVGLLYLMHIGWWPIRYVLYVLGIAGAVSIIEHFTGWLTPPLPEIEDVTALRHTQSFPGVYQSSHIETEHMKGD